MRVFSLLPTLAVLTCASIANASEGSFIIQVTVPISPRGTGWEVDFEQMQVPVAVPGAMPEDVLKALAIEVEFRMTASPDDLKKFQRLERTITLEAKK